MKGSLSRTSSTCSLISRATAAAFDNDSDETTQPPPCVQQRRHLERDALELAWYSTVSAYSKLTNAANPNIAASATTRHPTTEDRLIPLSKAAELFSIKFQESRLSETSPTSSPSSPPPSPSCAASSLRSSSTTNTHYCAGLWPSLLPASLLWFAVYPKRRLPADAAPTWSWASIAGGHIYWDAQWAAARASGPQPWPLAQEACEIRSLAQVHRRFPRLDRGLRVLRTRCLQLPAACAGSTASPAPAADAAAAQPFGAVSKGVIKLRCCLCPALPVPAGPVTAGSAYGGDARRGGDDAVSSGGGGAGRAWHGCIIYDARMRKAVAAKKARGGGAELSDGDWVATQLRAWEDHGRRNDHLKLLFDCEPSPEEQAARKFEVLYCVRFYEYAPSSVAWGHHDGLLVRYRKGTKNEFERVGLWKCTRASMFDDKYQVINLV
ncbi:hypothetical protein B0J12DRAFT_738617 [Macrophomina phaseolina]|uniref:Uncharacterized protein n=1 Tax=Macrophomina phaseolina TaxID=35725 RepID=A0ABQ8GHI4_9PEZI|nr:hypothetical protein B0J12DRAFT_738617 [Macrophomina phaseolina]